MLPWKYVLVLCQFVLILQLLQEVGCNVFSNENAVFSLARTKDRLWCGLRDSRIGVWEWMDRAKEATQEEILEMTDGWVKEKDLIGNFGRVESLTPLPDLDRMLSGSSDGRLRVWSCDYLKCEKTIDCHTDSLTSICIWKSAGDVIVTGSLDGRIRLWSSDSLMPVNEVAKPTARTDGWDEVENYGIRSMAVLEQPYPIIAAGCLDGKIRIWNLDSLECERILDGHIRAVTCMCYSEGTLYSGSADSTVRAWNIESWDCEMVIEPENEIPEAVQSLNFIGERVFGMDSHDTSAMLIGTPGEIVVLAVPSFKEILRVSHGFQDSDKESDSDTHSFTYANPGISAILVEDISMRDRSTEGGRHIISGADDGLVRCFLFKDWTCDWSLHNS
mmetsp:Transcript_778/g.1239  ORF Transcript_778/g.1239 Transcript_778/m.1239 type:complete len:388 (+) Transcript_778:748-1911(+)